MNLPLLRARDVLVAATLGAAIAFTIQIWLGLVSRAGTINDYLWLAKLQEPGLQAGEYVARRLYPTIGYPRNLWAAGLCLYAILIGMWMFAILSIILLGRTGAALLRKHRPSRDVLGRHDE